MVFLLIVFFFLFFVFHRELDCYDLADMNFFGHLLVNKDCHAGDSDSDDGGAVNYDKVLFWFFLFFF